MFSFFLTGYQTKIKEHSLAYYSPLAGGRIIGIVPFPIVLAPCEMQAVSCRVWTRVAVSISFDDIHYIRNALVLGERPSERL